jgi:hypothetical protein
MISYANESMSKAKRDREDHFAKSWKDKIDTADLKIEKLERECRGLLRDLEDVELALRKAKDEIKELKDRNIPKEHSSSVCKKSRTEESKMRQSTPEPPPQVGGSEPVPYFHPYENDEEDTDNGKWTGEANDESRYDVTHCTVRQIPSVPRTKKKAARPPAYQGDVRTARDMIVAISHNPPNEETRRAARSTLTYRQTYLHWSGFPRYLQDKFLSWYPLIPPGSHWSHVDNAVRIGPAAVSALSNEEKGLPPALGMRRYTAAGIPMGDGEA